MNGFFFTNSSLPVPRTITSGDSDSSSAAAAAAVFHIRIPFSLAEEMPPLFRITWQVRGKRMENNMMRKDRNDRGREWRRQNFGLEVVKEELFIGRTESKSNWELDLNTHTSSIAIDTVLLHDFSKKNKKRANFGLWLWFFCLENFRLDSEDPSSNYICHFSWSKPFPSCWWL